MFIIKYKKIFLSVSLALVLLSISSLFVYKLPLGIDFKGGALTEITYTDVRPNVEVINQALSNNQSLGTVLVQPEGDKNIIVRTKDLNESERQVLISALNSTGTFTINNYTSIGPSVGKELKNKMILAIIFVSIIIILFIAYAFRNVSRPVKSWKYGVIAVITLLHDIIIPVGVFAILSRIYHAEVDTLFVVALLTVIGLSVSDTIVVFDRIRENLKNKRYVTFAETVGNSLEQVYTRSINTSMTVIIVLVALSIFGPSTTKVFALMMTAGMFFGTYSSIFLASPMLVLAEELQNRKK
ncbi:protein-export membrane protein SecF [Candidatus Nomurabacteria bacterium RIFCSPHIGHO2_02_FULL_38_15]|uniref:Protein-export membrane protein SecF n=1 Tax=Candidatus Nomurabacteria bacterium RIFCSPHIGHO2_02_FULL_38_15 TaxID=1801752 RepID=A0A1F6VRP2_9BACT|nr:MAG: protein-export membrane protein SecF [Candidatus Nomurabacteria bacterium RIFCSPHIGHO2_02_FULL_38_15]